MARARSLKPGFFKNEDLASLDPLARLLFAGLWTLADREGRLEDRPKRIKVEVLPYDECDVDGLLWALHRAGFILRYEVAGARYIQVVNFKKHQTPHIKEPASVIPAPDMHGASTVPAPDTSDSSTAHASDQHESGPSDSLNLTPDSLNPYTPLPPLPASAASARRRRGEEPADFARFWAAYPRKVARPKALQAWLRLSPSPDLVEQILAAVARQRASPQWRRDGGQYIPHPATYLNQRRWEDMDEVAVSADGVGDFADVPPEGRTEDLRALMRGGGAGGGRGAAGR
ncbi:MAG: phage replication protein [Bacillota bacterium]|nr:phage replication protein [Bacillota bacterium]